MAHTGRFEHAEEPTKEQEHNQVYLSYAERIGGRQSQYRREELIRKIEHAVTNLTLQELEALYYDMSTKNYIND